MKKILNLILLFFMTFEAMSQKNIYLINGNKNQNSLGINLFQNYINVNNNNKNNYSENLTSKWVPDTILEFREKDTLKSIFEYDQNGNIKSLLELHFINNLWENNNRYSYTCDNNGNLLNCINDIWQDNTWVKYWTDTCDYNKFGDKIYEISEHFIQDKWQIDFKNKITYIYDENNKKITFLSENLPFKYKGTYTYFSDSLILLNEQLVDDKWLLYDKITYTYNKKGKITNELYENFENLIWVNSSKVTYSYDENANLINEINEIWENNEWQKNTKLIFVNDTNGNCISAYNQKWVNNLWQDKDGFLFILFNKGKDKYEDLGIKVKVHYKELIVDEIDNPKANSHKLKIFPNPVNDYFYFNCNKIKNLKNISIYDILGHEVLKINSVYFIGINNLNSRIDIRQLGRGVYLIKYESDNGIENEKFIKY